MGGRGRYGGRAAAKGKGIGSTVAKAVPQDSTALLDLLRAYPAEDGSIFIHRNGARSDSQLLEPAFLSQVLSHDNQLVKCTSPPTAALFQKYHEKTGNKQ